MPEISQATKNLIEKYQAWSKSNQQRQSSSTIQVDEVASKVAGFYEKLRGIVDWKEEHLIKRAAISRNLKRRLILANNRKNLAEDLVLELIRGGHFPNNQIEETKINQVEKALEKYIYILEKSNTVSSEEQKIKLYNWLLSIAACEIEEILSDSHKEKFLIDFMAEVMSERIEQQSTKIISFNEKNEQELKKEKNKQVYIACQRALFKLDSPIITYHLLKKKYNQWQNVSEQELKAITENIYSIWLNLEKDLNHPSKDKFYKICQKYNTPFLLIQDILAEQDVSKINDKFNNPAELETLIKQVYSKRLATLKNRLSRAAFYSTLSILITNSFALFVIEVPLARIIMGTFSYTAIMVDILGPTFLMFLLVATIKLPSKNNLEIVLIETMKIIYQTEKKDVYEIKIPRKKSFIVKSFIAFLYFVGASISLTMIILVLRWAGLPPTSYFVNVMFVALIAFAGLAIRNKGEELTVEDKKVGFFSFIFDILFLPIVSLGRWLSNKWKKYNAISIFFNALIDLPWQIFVEFLEQWRNFLKEKKEEIY
jgi:hypothetical protein